MEMVGGTRLAQLFTSNQEQLLAEWFAQQHAIASRRGLVGEAELRNQFTQFVSLLMAALASIRARRFQDARMAGSARVSLGDVRSARASGFHAGRDRDVRVLAEAAAVHASARGARRRRRGARRSHLDRQHALRRARPLHDRSLPDEPRAGHRAPAAGTARALDARRAVVGRHSRAAADRHARQRAHAGRDGEPAAEDRRDRRRDRDHRHHRRADRRYAGRAAPAEDGRGGAADGRGLHHQRHSSADRADHRASRRGPGERHDQGDAGGCLRRRAAAQRLRRSSHAATRAHASASAKAARWNAFRFSRWASSCSSPFRSTCTTSSR